MRKIYRIFGLLFVFLILGLITCFVTGFFFSPFPHLLSIFEFKYKIYYSLLLFIDFFSVVQITAFMFGLSIKFGKIDDENYLARSEAMLSYLKGVFVICIITVGCYVGLTEALKPVLEKNIQKQKQYTVLYTENVRDASKLSNSYSQSELENAEKHIKNALSIYPTSVEARGVYEKIKVQKAKLKIETTNSIQLSEIQEENYDAKILLNMAKEAFEKKDFFSAHYHASQAIEMSQNDLSLKKDARKIEVESWNTIQVGDFSTEEQNRNLYRQKRIAYDEFKAGELVKAYSSFFEIQKYIKQENKYAYDRQVEYFLKLIRNKLSSHVFFVDELETIQAFLNGRNLEFSVNENHRMLFKIFAEGIAFGSRKNPEIYLHKAQVTKYDYAENILWSANLHYARLIPDFTLTGKKILVLQMTGINSDRTKNDIIPIVTSGYLSGKESLSQILPISINDFCLVNAANRGINTLDFVSIFVLSKKAEMLGFSKDIILIEFVQRIGEFLLLFLLSILSCTIAWRYRLRVEQTFKFIWYFSLPLFFLLSQILVDASRLLAKITAELFVLSFQSYAIIVYIICWIIALIITSIIFILQHKN